MGAPTAAPASTPCFMATPWGSPRWPPSLAKQISRPISRGVLRPSRKCTCGCCGTLRLISSQCGRTEARPRRDACSTLSTAVYSLCVVQRHCSDRTNGCLLSLLRVLVAQAGPHNSTNGIAFGFPKWVCGSGSPGDPLPPSSSSSSSSSSPAAAAAAAAADLALPPVPTRPLHCPQTITNYSWPCNQTVGVRELLGLGPPWYQTR